MKAYLKINLLGLLCLCSLSITQAQFDVATPKKASFTNEQIYTSLRGYYSQPRRDINPSYSLQQKFNRDFPQARDIEWEKSFDVYKVEFEQSVYDYEAFYDNDNNLLMYGNKIPLSELPQEIRDQLQLRYPSYNIDDVMFIHQGNGKFFKIRLEYNDLDQSNRNKDMVIILQDNGTAVEEWYEED